MATVITLDTATRLKLSLRRFAEPCLRQEEKPVAEVMQELKPATAGHALYLIYWLERGKQGFEEFKWESLDIGQRLVWHRTAERLGLKLGE
jgi:hypothetical protein